MLLEIDLLTLYLCVGLNLPPLVTQYVDRLVGLALKFLKRYDSKTYDNHMCVRQTDKDNNSAEKMASART